MSPAPATRRSVGSMALVSAGSFVFGGESGRLDHVFLSPGAAALLRGAAHWHNNADEPAASAYEAGTDLSAYGASDHDPLVIGGDWQR